MRLGVKISQEWVFPYRASSRLAGQLAAESHLGFFQASETAKVPEVPGIYAWYYRPLATSPLALEAIAERLSALIHTPAELVAEVRLSYNMRLKARAQLSRQVGRKHEYEHIKADVLDLVRDTPEFFRSFVREALVPHFSRPLYIGIATNLRRRIHTEHWMTLSELEDANSSASRFLRSNPNASLTQYLRALGENHSFAAEARFRGISARDIAAQVYSLDPGGSGEPLTQDTEDTPRWRSLERVLQLLAEPFCGRI